MIVFQFVERKQFAQVKNNRGDDRAETEENRSSKEDLHQVDLIAIHREKSTDRRDDRHQPDVLPKMWTRNIQRRQKRKMIGEQLTEDQQGQEKMQID